ncbi:MAG: aldehyde dehydrogenase family protein [Caldisericia bacterium]
MAAAYGFQGQKCSACSRLIVVGDEQHDKLVEKLVESKKSRWVMSEMVITGYGPVSSASAYKTITEYIEIGRKEGKNLLLVET